MKTASQRMRIASGTLIVVLTIFWTAEASKDLIVSIIVAILFLGSYFFGAWRGAKAHAHALNRQQKWGHGKLVIIWIAVLTLIWFAMLLLSKVAVWLAFPLIFLQVGVLGTLWGSVAAAVTCAATIWVSLKSLSPGDPIQGAVLGPVIGTSIAVILTWAAMAIANESRSRRIALEELVATKQLLENSERKQLLEAERGRIAAEIHDTVNQDLAAAAMLLKSARLSEDLSRVRTLIEHSLVAIEDGLTQARRVTQALAPKELQGCRLSEALHALPGEAWAAGLDVSVTTDHFDETLPLDVEVALLRVTQAALANVKEHAGTEEATVTLNIENGNVLVEVRDEGQGFEVETAAQSSTGTRGMGLRNMKHRMNDIGGSFQIASGKNGTLVRASVPIHRPYPTKRRAEHGLGSAS